MATPDKPNYLVIISDEHRRDAMGCMGHPLVKTPHLDGLATRGTLFTNAYTASPMCVPTRAALATGRYVNRHRFWDSATPYDGSVTSWMHRVRDSGCDMASIGKLHFRDGDTDNGFSQEILPMHVVGGVGWAVGLLRDSPPAYDVAAELAADSGCGETSYTAYDRAITSAATDWISAPERLTKPWAAFVSLVSPHYPLSAPDAFYEAYAKADFDLAPAPLPDHPEIRNLAGFFDYDRHFTAQTRRAAKAGYFGLTSFMDDCVGRILAALADSGQADNTVVVYLSDHGEMLGDKGLWTKQVMYEASAGIPMIMAGPEVPSAHVCTTAVSLLDVAATALDLLLDLSLPDQDGTSLRTLARNPDDPERTVLSEYHDGGSSTGAFMVRWQNWKYVHYAGLPPQLFNLASDPEEDVDLGADPAHQHIRDEGLHRLHDFCDPEAVNSRCFADQARRIKNLGGVDACRDAYVFNHTPTPAEQTAMEGHHG